MLEQMSFGGVKAMSFCSNCGRPLSNPISVSMGIGPICRGHSGKGNEVNKNSHDNPKWGEHYEYEGYHGCKSHCQILVAPPTIMVTEAPTNEGTSVTNMAEDLAAQLAKAYGIKFEVLTWIEHYQHDESLSGIPETFDLVTFTPGEENRWGKHGPCLIGPRWQHITRQQAKTLLGEKFPQDP